MDKILITRFRKPQIPEMFSANLKKDKFEIVCPHYKDIPKTLYNIFKNRKKYKRVILISEPNWYTYLVMKTLDKKTEKIAFPYDIRNFRAMQKSWSIPRKIFNLIDRYCEKIVFIKSDKILHKGKNDELSELKFYNKIKNKPHYLFREFLDKSLDVKYISENKLSAKDGKIHLAYAGVIHIYNDFVHEKTINIFKRIVDQKIHLHVFGKSNPDIIELNKNNEYFHYEGSVHHSQLIKKLSIYDYGLDLHGRKDYKYKSDNIWDQTSFSNKLYDYILSKIPIIYSTNLKAVDEFIKKWKIGIGIPYTKTDDINIPDTKSEEYHKIIKNMEKYIKTYTNDELLNFIKK